MGRVWVRARNWAAICAAAALVHCERTAVYDPHFPDQASFRVHHLGTYSSKLMEGDEKEREGTIFQTRMSCRLEKQDGGWRLQRHLDTLDARGYHKFSMPNELEKKIDLVVWLGPDRIPVRVAGYESLAVVLSRIPQKEEFRKQLLKASDTAAYKAWQRDWWRLADFLPHGKELEARKPLGVEAINGKLETFKADSARFDGPRPRGTSSKNRKSCLEYTLYYHRADSLALLVEQFFFSALQNHKYRTFKWRPGAVNGTVQFSVEKTTGLPCFHARSETGTITLEKKEEKLEVPIELYRYEEDIYEY